MIEAGDEGQEADLVPLNDDDPLLDPPSRVTKARIDPQLTLLPTHEMAWLDFERLLLRVARDVRGLRALSLFGNSGQAQDGLDVVGLNASNEVEGVQSKRLASFGLAALNTAVDKFVQGSLEFSVSHLFIGVASSAHERSLVERVIELNRLHAPLEIELWDRDRLSEILRRDPEIVLEFFGPATATSFCVPHTIGPVVVPGPDAVSLADAVLVGPASTGPARTELDQARAARKDNPAAALEHLQNAKRVLAEAGFPAHAVALDAEVVELLIRLGRDADAARMLLDRVWEALAVDSTSDAARTLRDLEQFGDGDPQQVAPSLSASATAVARAAINIYEDPLGQLPEPEAVLAVAVGNASDQARLLLLAGEIALADDAQNWLAAAAPLIVDLAGHRPDVDEFTAHRLRLLEADVDGEWTSLLHDARTRTTPRPLGALTLARHARYLAARGDFQTAKGSWTEAVEKGCLAGLHEDASNWLYARRSLAMRYAPGEDVWHPVAAALRALPAQPPISGSPRNVRERALSALHDEKPREAVLRLRRHLRDNVISGSWQGEEGARALLASTYAKVGEFALAARHAVAAGNTQLVKQLSEQADDVYLDVREHLDAPTYWVAATAYRLVALQGDLVPDEHIAEVAGQALVVLDAARDRTLVDTPLFGPSLYRSAFAALSAIADRLSETDADHLIAYLETLPDVPEGHSRHTDDDHALAVASIAHVHPPFRERALDQLLTLFARAPHSVKGPARDLLAGHLPLTRERLVSLATAGSSAAAELLAHAEPDQVAPETAKAAANALTAPVTSRPGLYATGTNAVDQSIPARALPPDQRAELIHEQLRRVQSPYEPTANRIQYLLAAANLTDNLADSNVEGLFELAIAEATSPVPSDADALTGDLNHPLGVIRIDTARDSRPAAAFLAAKLARTDEQRQKARSAALRLIGARDELHVTRALQVLQDDLSRDTPYLAKQGWALRSLAAIAWVNDEVSGDTQIGALLARDRDPRVRRTLAGALSPSVLSPRTDGVRDVLRSDPRYSVRRLIPPLGSAAPSA